MTPSSISHKRGQNRIVRLALPLAVWLGVWQVAALLVGKELLLPGPAAVVARLGALMGEPLFWHSAGLSLGRIFLGYVVGALLGAALGAATSASRAAHWIFAPMVGVIRATPVASFIVLLLLWAPNGQVPAIAAGLMVLPVLWGNVSKGIAQTDRDLLEAARAYRFGRGKTVGLVYLPSVLPYFASGCNTALGLAWKSGVAAEVLCQPQFAIGTRLYGAKITLETPSLFAWTLVVIALSFLLEYALGFLFRRLGRGKM